MYIEHRSDRVTPQCAAFHGASANPASLQTTPDGSITLVVTKKRCSANSFFKQIFVSKDILCYNII
jgi:hypothetical protein